MIEQMLKELRRRYRVDANLTGGKRISRQLAAFGSPIKSIRIPPARQDDPERSAQNKTSEKEWEWMTTQHNVECEVTLDNGVCVTYDTYQKPYQLVAHTVNIIKVSKDGKELWAARGRGKLGDISTTELARIAQLAGAPAGTPLR
jgi:hypothetical protein